MEEYQCITIDNILIQLTPVLALGCSSIEKILTDHLSFFKVCTSWVICLFIDVHKQQRMELARNFLEMYQLEGKFFFKWLVYRWWNQGPSFTAETKGQTMVWKRAGRSTPKKAMFIHLARKIMTIVFWDSQEVFSCAQLYPIKRQWI